MSSFERASQYKVGVAADASPLATAPHALEDTTARAPDEKSALKLVTSSFRGIYAVLGLLLVGGFTYLLGYPILEGAIVGNDSAYALSIISWIDQWFPQLPLWYPLQGAGASSIVQYPYGSHYLVVIVHRVTGLSIFEAFRLAQLLSVALTACGVYLLVWVKLKGQTAALIAGLAYPLSNAVWSWVTDVGLFAQAFSLIYFVPTLLLFDLYVLQESKAKTGRGFSRRGLAFAAAAFLFALMFITHGSTALVFALTILAYVALHEVLTNSDQSLPRRLGSSLARTGLGIATGLFLVAFWIIPYLHLSGLANREGVAGEFALHQIPYLDLLAMVGLGEPPAEWGMWALGFASTVLVFAALAIVLGVRKNRTVVVWTVLAISFALFTAMPGLSIGLVETFQKLWGYLYVRALTPTMIFLAALAGYGPAELANRIVNVVAGAFDRLGLMSGSGSSPGALASIAKRAVAASLAIALALAGFVYLRRSPTGNEFYPGYGPMNGVGNSVLEFSGPKVSLARPPGMTLNSSGYEAADLIMPVLIDTLELKSSPRIDVSPFLGGFLQILPLYTEASTINIYAYGASLIHAMWGYQQGAFFSDEFGTPHEIDELARWLGIEYVFLNAGNDPLYKYDAERWPIVTLPADTLGENIEVRRFANPTGMASVLRRPTVLVIGGVEFGAYEQVFKVLNSGALEFRDGLAVEGNHFVDDYSPDELMNFDAVIMHGYGYKDPEKAWEILDEYVRQGGSLFVETGWQYRSPEWESQNPPALLPTQNLDWQPSPKSGQFAIVDRAFADDVALDKFAPMIWAGEPWGLSSPTVGLRDWARPVLTLGSVPVVAVGDYGQGRVAWSGMNIFAHIRTYESDAEIVFLGNLVDWLLEGSASQDLDSPQYARKEPDNVRFSVKAPIPEGSYLLWREAQTPDWSASGIVNGESFEVPVLRAGAGMMLMPLPAIEQGSVEVELEYDFGWIGIIGKATSLVTLLALPLIWPASTRVAERLRRIAQKREKHPAKGRVAWLEDSESFKTSPMSGASHDSGDENQFDLP